MKAMSVMDAAWLLVESENTPMHVGSLLTFTRPEGASDTFLRDMVDEMKKVRDPAPPWDLKLYRPNLPGRMALPAWQEDRNLDLEYHVRHSALPAPGGERELGVLVSRLHSHPLDFTRPLWECHLIEGLENDRFALYAKMHHSLIDGISGMRLLQRIMSRDPAETAMPAPWHVRPRREMPELHMPEFSLRGGLRQVVRALRSQIASTPELAGALNRLARASREHDGELTGPFDCPSSILNKRITAQRRFATQQYSLALLKRLAKQADASLNDIVLYLCGTALRRFLREEGQLPEESLTAGIPVNIRPADDDRAGTAISFMIATLGTSIRDPLRRLERIKASTRSAKAHLQSLPRNALTQYTMLMMAPYILQLVSGLGGRSRPVFNVTISNVPGPDEQLYYNGSAMEAMYPVSLVAHGAALNITCLSYAGSLNFGYTGCRDTLPSMQRLAVYTGEALEELEQVLEAGTGSRRKAAP